MPGSRRTDKYWDDLTGQKKTRQAWFGLAGPKWSFEKIQSVEMDRNSIGETLVNDATSLVFLKYGVFLAHIVALHCPSYHHSVLVRLDYFLLY